MKNNLNSIPNGLSFNPTKKRKQKQPSTSLQKKPLSIKIQAPCVKNAVILSAKENPLQEKGQQFQEQIAKQKLNAREADLLEENVED